MSDFQQTIKWLKEGKKVKRKIWVDEVYVRMRENQSLEFGNGLNIDVGMSEIEATDWEIFEGEEISNNDLSVMPKGIRNFEDLRSDHLILEREVRSLKGELEEVKNIVEYLEKRVDGKK